MQATTAIKWAAVATVGLLGVYLVNRALTAGTAVVDAAGDALWAVSPTNNDNVIYQTANWATGGKPDYPLGSRVYDWWNPNPLAPKPPRVDYTDPAKPLTNADGYDFSLF